MGGYGSGRHYQHGKKTTGQYPSIDVRVLRRNGLLVPGRTSSLNWSVGDHPLLSIQIEARADQIILHDRTQDCVQRVGLDFTECHLSGKRPWFLCPNAGCGKRVALLYRGHQFMCRHCLSLTYASQSEAAHARATRRADKLRQKLGWPHDLVNLAREKPKGMHWRTYLRLQAEYDGLVNRYLTGLTERYEGLVRYCC